jgi:hypothetical protein
MFKQCGQDAGVANDNEISHSIDLEKKPFHEMTLQEYLSTSDSQKVSRFSIAALQASDYTAERLTNFPSEHLKALAQLWGVARNGPKQDLVRRIIRRKEFRERLLTYSPESLCQLPRKELVEMAKEAGLFYSALNKTHLATQLIAWRKSEADRAAHELGEARHFRLVQKALHAGLWVPVENRERYGLDTNGQPERQIFQVPRSVAARRAPEAIAAARELSQQDFQAWVQRNPEAAHKANFITASAMITPSLFWSIVRSAYESDAQGNLFG